MRRLGGTVFVAVALVVLAAVLAPSAHAAEGLDFDERRLPLEEKKLFDIGVADRTRDGRLDVYSINHSYPASWLEQRRRGFRESTRQLGLIQDARFPGWEVLLSPPPPPDRGPGLYAYLSKADLGSGSRWHLILEARGRPASGRVLLDPPRAWETVAVSGGTVTGQDAPELSRVRFQLAAGGRAEIRVAHPDLPVALVSDAPPATPLFLGSEAVPAPGGLRASPTLRDRHGYALGDLDGDGREDLFAVVGGLGSAIERPPFRGHVFDEILAGGANRFGAARVDVPKDDCRGRQADLVDVNADGRLDMFTGCEGAIPAVHVRTQTGFARTRIPGAEATAYRWIAADRDAAPELLAAGSGPARVFDLGPDGWKIVSQAPLRSGAEEVRSLSIADFDRDGGVDAFAASPAGNTLLVGDGKGGLRARAPKRLRLPGASSAASWVDADLDGRLDLHALPQGLYRGKGRRFGRTGELGVAKAQHGVSLWADLDNDGRRDPITAIGKGEMGARHDVIASRNRSKRRGHWLEVDLPGAMQTARVAVRWSGERHVGWAGEADDSPFSQTHNRVYFGLGKGKASRRARVTVSGLGRDTVRMRVEPDRVVRVPAA